MTKKKNNVFRIASIFTACLLAAFSADTAGAREMTEFPRVKLQSLDKATARTMTFEANVGDTLKFGPLYIKVQTCKKSSPIDEPESAAFLQIWEVTPEKTSEWVFSGWMFASSPGLSSMDHPIYDVWVLDCLEEATQTDDLSDAQKEADQNADEASEENKAEKPESDLLE